MINFISLYPARAKVFHIPPLSPTNAEFFGSLKSVTQSTSFLLPTYDSHSSILTHCCFTAHKNLFDFSKYSDPSQTNVFPHPETTNSFFVGHGASGEGRCAIFTLFVRVAGVFKTSIATSYPFNISPIKYQEINQNFLYDRLNSNNFK